MQEHRQNEWKAVSIYYAIISFSANQRVVFDQMQSIDWLKKIVHPSLKRQAKTDRKLKYFLVHVFCELRIRPETVFLRQLLILLPCLSLELHVCFELNGHHDASRLFIPFALVTGAVSDSSNFGLNQYL